MNKEQWYLCYAGHTVENNMWSESEARERADFMNSLRRPTSVSSFCFHPQSEIDANTVCPHGRAAQSRTSHQLLAELGGSASSKPRLAALLMEIRRGEEESNPPSEEGL